MKFKIIEIEMTSEELRANRTIGQNIAELLAMATEPVTDSEDEAEGEE